MRRDDFTIPIGFADELIIDNFAGGGGTSEGLERAFGRPVDIAINHDPVALAMHAINHPRTLHLCESVWDVDPIKVTRNQPVALVWLSPDCKHFSKAKGGTPVSQFIRGLAWVALRWVVRCKPRAMMLENVEEFQTWGPLMLSTDGKWYPNPARRGETFRAFVQMLRQGIPLEEREGNEAIAEMRAVLCAEGDPLALTEAEVAQLLDGMKYDLEWDELRACDYNTPTIRKRFFMVGRRDGLPVVTRPDPTHGAPISKAVSGGQVLPWRTAAEVIDFTIKANSIFGRKKDLAKNTQRRVAKGLWRHVLNTDKRFIVGAGGPAYSGKPASAEQPLGTLTTENHRAVAQPVLAPFVSEHANASNQRNMAANEPLRTQCAQVKGGHFSLVAPALAPLRGTSEAHLNGDAVTEPVSTISASGTHHALAAAHLITIGYGERPGQDARTQDIQGPAGTAVAGGIKQALVAAHLVDMGHGESSASGAVRWSHGNRSMEQPLPTATASGVGSAVVACHLTHLTHHGDRPGRIPDEPLPAITGAHRGEQVLVAACLEQANGGFYDGEGRSADAPVSTITAAGSNQRLVMAYCVKYFGVGENSRSMLDPVSTVTSKDRIALVETMQVPTDCLALEHREKARLCAALLHEHLPEHFPEESDMVLVWEAGQWWVLVDITLRMLKPLELFRAQGFPATYIIHEIPDPALLFKGGVQAEDPLSVPRIPLSITAQVRMCGNSVCPPLAEALARANFVHEAQIYGRVA
ncbi:DNA cytosine methyltransferase [Variovorax sp. AFSI2.2]|uniref:DNA cytosine methyltransferase n=1 Tax=Variovorax sp. AFSI2.2 TaxID=3384160 RepID=UPI003EB84106